MKRHKTAFKLPIQQNKFLFPSLRNMTLNPFADYDKDGVNNAIDCRPFNRRFQDAKPNWMQRERMRKLPIFVIEKKVNYFAGTVQNLQHITAKNAPEKTRRAAYSIIKHHPSLIGDIERQRPHAVIFTSGGIKADEPISGFSGETKYKKVLPQTKAGRGVAVIDINEQYNPADRTENAKTVSHELEHLRQHSVGRKRPKIQVRWSKGRYETQRAEVMSRQKEEELERKTPLKDGFTRREYEEEPNEEGVIKLKQSAIQRMKEKISSGIKYVTSGGNEE